jgi:hypothetical protein
MSRNRDKPAGLALATVLMTAMGTSAAARPAGLMLERGRKVCISEDFILTGFPAEVRPQVVSTVVMRELGEHLRAKGIADGAVTIVPVSSMGADDQDDCNAAQGDITLRLRVAVDRIEDRYTITLLGRDRQATYRDAVSRNDAGAGPRTPYVVPDEGPFDAWAAAVEAGLAEDASSLAARFSQRISIPSK